MTGLADDGAAAALRYYGTVDGGNARAVTALFTSDAVYHRPGYEAMRGAGEILRFYDQDRVIVSGRHAVTSLVSDAETVAVQGIFSGELRDGSVVELGFADFFRFDDGLIATRTTYFAVPAV